jgi:hypothetical protein
MHQSKKGNQWYQMSIKMSNNMVRQSAHQAD